MDTLSGAGSPVADSVAAVSSDTRTSQLSVKELANKLDQIQNVRKVKLNQASALKTSIQDFMQSIQLSEVKCSLRGFIELCDEIRCLHDSLMGLLPQEEKERHETWFKAKMMFNDEFIEEVEMWVQSNENQMSETENNGDKCVGNDDINPNDSVSNVGKNSNESLSSHRSSTASSVKIKVAAKKAAVMARMAALKERHALEEQEQKIKRKKEQLDLETELAASDAMLAVFQAMDGQRLSQAPTDGMNSYFEKERRRPAPQMLNPLAKQYEPAACKTQSIQWISQQETTIKNCHWWKPHKDCCMIRHLRG